MKKILLKFLPLLFGLMTVLRAETIEQIGPVTTIDTTDAPDLSMPWLTSPGVPLHPASLHLQVQ